MYIMMGQYKLQPDCFTRLEDHSAFNFIEELAKKQWTRANLPIAQKLKNTHKRNWHFMRKSANDRTRLPTSNGLGRSDAHKWRGYVCLQLE